MTFRGENNTAGTSGFRELESEAIDNLPPRIRQLIFDAPISFGAWGVYQKMKRLRITEDWEIEAYAVDLEAKMLAEMRNGPASTPRFWTDHPQAGTVDKIASYQLIPRKKRPNTRITRVD